MPVDPQIQALLDKGASVPATHTLPVEEARRLYNGRAAIMKPGPDMADVAERAIGRAVGAAHLHA